jgi:hypothetical protein
MSTGQPSPGGRAPRPTAKRPVRRIWYLLLVLPFVATLVPPFYARIGPKAGPWPFFYWWQFAWIVITALILAVVYRLTTRRGGD